MEEMIMRNQTFMANSTPPSLSIRRDSRTIAKAKPKIRIIHVFAPEIIKTDAANFRELVQRLTGKPPMNSDIHHHHNKPSTLGKRRHRKVPMMKSSDDPSRSMMIATKMEAALNGLIGNTNSHDHQDDYFSGLSDIDRFFQDISQLPFIPVDPSIHSSFEASQLV